MRLLLALFFSLFVTACDVNIQSEEPDPDPTVQPVDTSSRNPGDTALRYLTVEDTLSKTPTTVTLSRSRLRIRGTDTTVLSVDTVRISLGSTFSALPPCQAGYVTIYNAYGSPLALEIWTGKSMEYQGGRVYGTELQKLASQKIEADSTNNRVCQLWKAENQYALIIAGIAPDPGGPSYLLGHGQFQTSPTSIFVIEEDGRIRQSD